MGSDWIELNALIFFPPQVSWYEKDGEARLPPPQPKAAPVVPDAAAAAEAPSVDVPADAAPAEAAAEPAAEAPAAEAAPAE